MNAAMTNAAINTAVLVAMSARQNLANLPLLPRALAGLALEVSAVLIGGDFETVRDATEFVVEPANLVKLCVASLAAPRTPEMFDPLCHHGVSMRAKLRAALVKTGHS